MMTTFEITFFGLTAFGTGLVRYYLTKQEANRIDKVVLIGGVLYVVSKSYQAVSHVVRMIV